MLVSELACSVSAISSFHFLAHRMPPVVVLSYSSSASQMRVSQRRASLYIDASLVKKTTLFTTDCGFNKILSLDSENMIPARGPKQCQNYNGTDIDGANCKHLTLRDNQPKQERTLCAKIAW